MKKKSFLYSSYFAYVKPVIKLPIVRTYGSTIFTLLVTAIFIIFAIKPTVETILVLQKKLADANEVLQKVTQKVNNLSMGKKNYENLDQDIKDRISKAIPDTVSLQSVTQTLEQTAKRHEASISALQIQPLTIDIGNEAKVGSLKEISFTFNVESTYQNLFALLQELGTSSRLLSIENLSLSKASEGPGLIMSLSGKAYFLK